MHTPTLWKFTIRQMQRRPGRTVLTLLGIIIGVACVVAIRTTIDTTRQSFRDMFTAIGGRAELEIVAEGQGGFDPAPLLALLRQQEGIRLTEGLIQERAGLRSRVGIVPVLVLGVDLDQSQRTLSWQLLQGDEPRTRPGVLLEKRFAQQQSLAVGDSLQLATLDGLTTLPVAGVVESRELALFDGGSVLILPLSTARTVFKMQGVNSIRLVLQEGVAPEDVRTRLHAVLPQGFRAEEPVARGAMVRDSILSTDQGLSALSVVSLVGGGVVILNAFLMNLGERRKQLAILRALGTTRGQLMRILLREACLLGVVGTVLGIVVGFLLAQGLIQVYSSLLHIQLPPLQFTLMPVYVALPIGLGMSLLATIVPAWRAGQRSPLEAILARRSAPEPQQFRPHWTSFVGVGLIVLAGLLVLGIVRDWWPAEGATPLLAPATVLLLVGCVLGVPLILGPLFWFTSRILQPLLGFEGRLALRDLRRHPTRTALTVSVLMIGVMMTVSFGNTLLSNIADIDTWYRQTLQADYIVRGIMPDTGTLSASALPLDTRSRLSALPGVKEVGRVNFVPTLVEGRRAILLARDFLPDRALPLSLVQGEQAEVRAALARGEVVLGTTLARRTGLGLGDTLRLSTRQGEQSLRIAGVVKEYSVGGMAFYLDWEVARGLFQLTGVNGFEVYVQPGEQAQAHDALVALAGEGGLLLQSNAALRSEIDRAVLSVEGFMWLLIALIFVVASLGIVNTLYMNIQEQTRELGVLRSIGLQRSQVKKLVMAQAIALGVLSLIPGVVGGLKLAYLMHLATYPLSGHQVAFELHGLFLVGCGLVSVLVAGLASVLPARQASRLVIVDAIQYE